ncbi:hypothetical protein DPEC_G00345930 [Dallia pectoralis]|uniref:Uncharacterized protein n=1 Tax=Dallia pectoralis TaxID=75939 RepID=A0ACC2F431_DALPE|nr:hypothetical protein DPEC_G00345930 [Dallia pectoralis]
MDLVLRGNKSWEHRCEGDGRRPKRDTLASCVVALAHNPPLPAAHFKAALREWGRGWWIVARTQRLVEREPHTLSSTDAKKSCLLFLSSRHRPPEQVLCSCQIVLLIVLYTNMTEISSGLTVESNAETAMFQSPLA